MPAREDAVGFQTSCPNTPWYGEHYIGFTYAKSCGNNWHSGKVKDGVLYFGVGGTEWQTKDFQYVKVSHIDN